VAGVVSQSVNSITANNPDWSYGGIYASHLGSRSGVGGKAINVSFKEQQTNTAMQRIRLLPSSGWGPDTTRLSQNVRSLISGTILLLFVALSTPAPASENVPHRPFAMFADLPERGQFVVGLVYEESEAYHIWAAGQRHDITVKALGQSYGIDINQGYLALQYGIAEKWALDLNVGGTTAGWRYFDTGGTPQSTTGLMDFSFGLRYQIFNEAQASSRWVPTLTFRAGGVMPGSYNELFPFAPGTASAAIEPEILVRKHVGWPGLGVYGDGLFRWNRTTGNDQYITVIGLFQQIKGWELAVGYRHLQMISGSDIVLNGHAIDYPRDVREISDAIESGFSYTTSKRHFRYGFHSRAALGGNNTDSKFWVGGSIDIPFGGNKPPEHP
jgi:hypothetical protein